MNSFLGRVTRRLVIPVLVVMTGTEAHAQMLTLTPVSSSQINISWGAVSGGVQGYSIYRNGSAIADLPASQTSYQDKNLSPNTVYNYQLIVKGGAVSAQTPAAAPVAPVWQNQSFAAETGVFTAEFDAVPQMSSQDAVVGLSMAAAHQYDDLAAIVRFGVGGKIDVRNGAGYTAQASMTNTAAAKYHIRMVVDVPNKTYDVYVTPQGQSEVLLAKSYAFRSSQSSVSALANRGQFAEQGGVTVSNFSVSAAASGPSPSQPPTQPPALSGYPDDSNTGVPAGIVLKKSGSLTVNTNGAVIDALDISGGIVIDADNVTLKRSHVNAGSAFYAVWVKDGHTGVTIEDCDIDANKGGGQGIHMGSQKSAQVLRNNIYNGADGIDPTGDEDTLIQDNYVHAMNGTSDSHFDTIQADGGMVNLTIRHNTLVNENGQTSVVMIDDYWAAISGVIVDNNRLLGGGYTIYAGSWNGKSTTGVQITNNRIKKGYYGVLDSQGTNLVWSGNVDDATGAPINP